MREINLTTLQDALDIVIIAGFAITAVIILIPVVLVLKAAADENDYERHHLHLVRQSTRHRREASKQPFAVPTKAFEEMRRSVLPHIRHK